MADSVVKIGADLSELRRELAKLPNLSGDAAQETLIKVEKAVQRAEKASKASTKAIARSQKAAAKATEKSSKDATEGLKALFEFAGGSGEQIEKLTKIMEGMGSTAVVAGAGVLIAVAAIAAWATAIAGAVAGTVKAVQAAEDLEDSLAPFRELEGFEGLSPQVWESVQAANSSIEALDTIGTQAAQTLGAELAPVVEKVSFLLVKLGLMGLDAITAMAGMRDMARDAGVFLVQGLMVPVQGVINALNGMVRTLAMAAEAVGADGLAGRLSGAAKAMQQATDAAWLVDTALDGLGSGLEVLNELTGEYDERAHKLIDTHTELRNATDETTKAVDELNDKLDEGKTTEEERAEAQREAAEAARLKAEADAKRAKDLAKLSKQARDLISAETAHRMTAAEKIDASEARALERLSELTEARMAAAVLDTEAIDAYIEGQMRRTELEAEFSQQRIDLANAESAAKIAAASNEWSTYTRLAMESTAAVGNLVDVLYDRRLSQLEEGTEAHKKAAKRQFVIEKSLAIATAVLQATGAVLKTLSEYGPPVYPDFMAIAAMSATATIGTAGVASVAMAKPPALHTGGIVGRPAPDEADRRLRSGEAVLNARATAQMGESAINAANAGGSMGQGPMVVVVEYKNQVLDTQVSDLSRVPGSALRRAIKQGARVGHRSR